MKTIDAEKREMRASARLVRKAAFETCGPEAARLIAGHFLDHFRPEPGAVIGAYLPIKNEVSPLPLLEWLGIQGFGTALPIIVEQATPLAFALWRPGDELKAGPHGTEEPLHVTDLVTVDVMLVPLLAFDGQGRRLGYGGGYYDRTLAARRDAGLAGQARPVLAIGIAFSAQEVERLPHDPYDQTLDGVVTELGARRFNRSGLNI